MIKLVKFSSLISYRKHQHKLHKGESQQMGGEILNAAILSFSLIFVGWGIGALLLKIQGAEE